MALYYANCSWSVSDDSVVSPPVGSACGMDVNISILDSVPMWIAGLRGSMPSGVSHLLTVKPLCTAGAYYYFYYYFYCYK